VSARIEAYRDRLPSEAPELLVPEQEKIDIPEEPCVPEVEAGALSAAVLHAAMEEHGALIVRGLFPQSTMKALVETCDKVLDICDDPQADGSIPPSIYFNPPSNLISIMPNKNKELGNTRTFHRDSGSAMCIEAPSVAEALLQLYEGRGLKEIVAEYLGEPACLSVKKWVLRRSKLPVSEAGWHQDGAFMGTNINSINMWLPLNECGGETGAPGMDVVPLRLRKIASAEGAQFDWSVSSSHINDRFNKMQPLMPVFQAGDAFFFDHFYLHRTQYRSDFTKLRYAIETWFFGETAFPKNQIPIAW
jgi:hypothetical protein